MRRLGRSTTATTLLAGLVLSACAAGSDSGGPVDDAQGGSQADPASEVDTTCEQTTAGVTEASATEEPFPWDDPQAAVLPAFDTSEIISGGPPPDGITPIDSPCVVSVEAADQWLEDQESVMVVEVGDEARAYPLAIMTQHEIANDVLGGVPVAVTYCPLCNSGLAFEREVTTGATPELDGEVWDFGTSGRLLRSNLVMYDRQTRSLWSQFTGTALWGDPDVVGTELERLPTQVLAWETFRDTFPDGTVLGRDSMPGRSYGRNPYPTYEDNPSAFLFRGEFSQELDPNERVVGLGEEGTAVAIPLERLREEQVITVPVGEEMVTVAWTSGQASALDQPRVADGRDVGQTGAFLVEELEPQGDGEFLDPSTGAVHNITGETIEGDAPPLELVPIDDTFWFVWFAFRPDTAIAA